MALQLGPAWKPALKTVFSKMVLIDRVLRERFTLENTNAVVCATIELISTGIIGVDLAAEDTRERTYQECTWGNTIVFPLQHAAMPCCIAALLQLCQQRKAADIPVPPNAIDQLDKHESARALLLNPGQCIIMYTVVQSCARARPRPRGPRGQQCVRHPSELMIRAIGERAAVAGPLADRACELSV